MYRDCWENISVQTAMVGRVSITGCSHYRVRQEVTKEDDGVAARQLQHRENQRQPGADPRELETRGRTEHQDTD